MPATFPAFQHMASYRTTQQVQQDHARNLKFRGATDADCRIEKLEPCPEYSLDYKSGLRSTYQLHWTTYKGWQVYMLHTGCFAHDPKYEK